jgi:hypothetical protein
MLDAIWPHRERVTVGALLVPLLEQCTVPAIAERWHSELGVRTTVMGLPGTESAVMRLDQIGEAGGTDAHQSIGLPGELSEAVGALL